MFILEPIITIVKICRRRVSYSSLKEGIDGGDNGKLELAMKDGLFGALIYTRLF